MLDFLNLETKHIPTYLQLEETQRITAEIINNLSHAAIQELLGGDKSDVSKLFDDIFNETFNVLYGTQGLLRESHVGHLDKLHSSIEETLRIESPNYFLTSLFPDFDVNWHHLEWGSMAKKFDKLAIIAARDHGKSYYWSNIYPIWKMYRYKPKKEFIGTPDKSRYLNERGALICNDMGLGEELMDILKNTIEGNDIIAEKLVPDVKNNWAKTKIKTKNGVRFQAKSYGSRFRGRHPGWIVVDDFLDDSSIYSADQREKSINYFDSVIMNAKLKEGTIVVAGTPFHDKDLYGALRKKKSWRVFTYPSIFPNGTALWEDRYTVKDLLNKRADQGNLVFSREHLCKPIVSDSSIFPFSLVQKAFVGAENFILVRNRSSFPIKFDYVVTACDFAMSSRVGADYSVFGTFGIDSKGRLWLIHFWRGKGKSFDEQINVLKTINRNFQPDIMMLESNQFQQIFVQEADKMGLPVLGHHTGTNKYNLKKGLPSLTLLFERYKIKFPRGNEHSRNICDLMSSELTSIAWTPKGLEGVGEHDDCAMMLWLAHTAARKVNGNFNYTWLN